MANLTPVIEQLKHERSRLTSRVQSLSQVISALDGLRDGGDGHGERKISASGRARIAAAQRARWAKIRGQKVVPITTRKRRPMSAGARRKIAAAQKARWTKWRKDQKKG